MAVAPASTPLVLATGHPPVAKRRLPRAVLGWGLALALLVAGVWEVNFAFVQSRLFAALPSLARAELAPGRSDMIRFPKSGPYDHRHGHAALPGFVARLGEHGFRVESQMRWSPGLRALHAAGLPGPFREPSRPGLRITGRGGAALFDARGPDGYRRFADVPPVVVESLLFIEDRHLLDADPETRNPAVEWDRLARAMGGYLVPGPGPGGSTLATQLEKLRHSPGGLTLSASDKIQQMLAASVRAYREGPDTRRVREQLVVDYLNELPLAGAPGFGDVTGLDQGLVAWFDADPAQVDALLHRVTALDELEPGAALAYRRALALMLAARRPSVLLVRDRDALERRVDSYLRLLSAEGRIPAALARDASGLPLGFRPATPGRDRIVERKPVAPVRARLVGLLGVDDYPMLDALDLTVESTLDVRAQHAADAMLRALRDDPGAVRRAGIVGHRMLAAPGDAADLTWSFALYERGDAANRVLVQVDNGLTPLDVHAGTRLDLGSTSKLRTLLLYLELVADLHDELVGRPASELREVARRAQAERDALTSWVAMRLLERPASSRSELIEGALERRYSASSRETFFTGGGAHRFRNFDSRDDARRPSVREAFRHSVNLPFIRLMRDIVRRFEARARAAEGPSRADARDGHLLRFIEYEGDVYLRRFHLRHRAKSPDQRIDALLGPRAATPRRLAVVLRSVAPDPSPVIFAAEMRRRLPEHRFDDALLGRLYQAYGPDRFTLADRGYLAGSHPLELWTVGWLNARTPGSDDWEALRDASFAARMESYLWLLRPQRRAAQDKRIAIIRERDAFESVLGFWRELGYPFDAITPSYAAAIGSAGDRPAAIADLLGILMNDGRRLPVQRIERLRFAGDTPYETRLVPELPAPVEVVRPEVAAAARAVLLDVVEHGTARRARGAVIGPDGGPIAVAGKTGTGDHRHKTFDRGGVLRNERVVSRSAVFAFIVGDRHYGVVTAHVTGPDAENLRFTSALAVQTFRALAPVIAQATTEAPRR